MSAGGYALVDCNAFYCSCERVFDPRLLAVPVVVLSNNDGCVISRTQEAKDGGVKMGAPYHEVRPLLKKIGCVARSSNYTLYADMSARVQAVLRQFDFALEAYSIDESFLRLDGIADLAALGRELKERVFRWTGIPVGVGIGPTKSLAKIANKLAKKRGGVCLLMGEDIDPVLAEFPVANMWGIGRQYAALLAAHGIERALQLKQADDYWVQQHLTIVGLRIVHELRGIPCIELDEVPDPQKNLTCSRMFSQPVEAFGPLEEAISMYAERACQKLRNSRQLAGVVHAFIQTSRFKDDPYVGSGIERLPAASANVIEIVKAARKILRRAYRPGRAYNKAGITLLELSPEHITQPDLFTPDTTARDAKLMGAFEAINKAWGIDTLRLASSGLRREWGMKRNLLSPCYTTNWADIPRAK